MTYEQSLEKSRTPTPDPDGFWFLHRLSRPREYPWQADDGTYRWCESVYLEGEPNRSTVESWPLVTDGDFAADDWDCFEYVF